MDKSPEKPTRRRFFLTLVACVLIAGVAFGLIMLIRSTEPKAERTGATRKSAALVETEVVQRGTYRPTLVALGTVQASRHLHLSPRVSGHIVDIAPNFVPGGNVQAGDVLVTLDEADFRNVLAMRESELQQAQASLAIEEGRRKVAQEEFALIGEDIDQQNTDLVLRVPQINAARAQVAAAKAALDQARLDLQRTQITAPFDAHLLTRNVNVGAEVSPGTRLAELVGVDTYWISTTLPLRDLAQVEMPGAESATGAVVRIAHRSAWPEGVEREGHVTQRIGAVDTQTRLARVLVTVKDPLGLATSAPALMLGTIVEARIEGREIANVVRLSREYLREGSKVWCYTDDALEIRPVQVGFEDARFAYITEGLEDGDEIVTTHLATAAPGVGLKRIDESGETDEAP